MQRTILISHLLVATVHADRQRLNPGQGLGGSGESELSFLSVAPARYTATDSFDCGYVAVQLGSFFLLGPNVHPLCGCPCRSGSRAAHQASFRSLAPGGR